MFNVWSSLKQGAAAGVLSGGYPYARNTWYVRGGSLPAPALGQPQIGSLQQLVDIMLSGDVAYIGPGSYDEAVVIPPGKTNLTFFGTGSKGTVAIAPSAANAIPMSIEGSASQRTSDIRLVNIGLETNGTGTGLKVFGNIRRIAVEQCKIEGGSVALQLESTAAGLVADCRIEECELAWTETALQIAVSGGGDPVTQTKIFKNLFHNFSSRGLYVPTVHSADLWVLSNVFANQEDGSQPTNEYLSAAVANTTGLVAGNVFGDATNDVTKLAIAAGVIWGPNGTEAGWSTARPS